VAASLGKWEEQLAVIDPEKKDCRSHLAEGMEMDQEDPKKDRQGATRHT
jgi:hypothetical protein